jgi:hypothetical protein
MPASIACFDRSAQHLLGSSLAQSLAPARHARWISRHPMLKVPHAAEVLPIGIFNPRGHHVFIAQIELILQIVKRHHKPRRAPRRALSGMVSSVQSLLKQRPIDGKSEANQGMALIDQLLQIYLNNSRCGCFGSRLGRIAFPQKMPRFRPPSGNPRANKTTFHQIL